MATTTIRTHNKFKTTFYEGTGAKNEALRNAIVNEHKFLVSWQKSTTNYWYGSYFNKNKFINMLNDTDEEERKFYEVLTGHCNTYADLEWTDMEIQEDKVIKNFMTMFKLAFEAMNEPIEKRDVNWSISSGDSKKSLHFNYVGNKCWKNSKEQNAFWNHFKNKLHKIDNEHDNKTPFFYWEKENDKVIRKCIMDFAVYTTDRQWRTIYSHKHNSDRVLKPCNKNGEINAYEFDDFNESHDYNDWLTVRDVEREPVFYELPENLRKVCKIKPVEIKDNDLETILSTHVPNTCYKSTQGELIILGNVGVRTCIINGEENLTDNSFLVYKKGAVYFGCHDEGCKGRLKLIHELEESILSDNIKYFEDWRQLMEIKDISIEEIEEYCKKAFAFVFDGGNSFWITKNIKDDDIHFRFFKTLAGDGFDIDFYVDDKRISLVSVLKRIKLKIAYDTVDFMPYSPVQIKNNPELSQVNKKVFNLFTGFKASPIWDLKPLQKSKVDILLWHIKNIWCRGDLEAYEYILNWLAHIIQFPNKKIGVMLVFKSKKQGAGKNIIFDLIKEWLFKKKNCLEINKIEQLTGKFNSLIENKLLTLCDEVGMFGNDHRNGDVLKSIITQKKQTIERKGSDAVEVNDYNNFIALTNNDWAMKIECGDRRHLCCELSNEKVDDEKYFKQIGDCFNKECGDIFYSMLLFRDISTWNKLNIPMTEYKREMKLYSTPLPIRYMIDIIKKPEILRLVKNRIHTSDMFESFNEWINSNGHKKTPSKERFNINLKDIGLIQKQFKIGGVKRVGYTLNFEEIKEEIKDYLKDPNFNFTEIVEIVEEEEEEDNNPKHTNDEVPDFDL